LLYFMMFMYIWVRSSSLRCCPSTDGRTAGGGTGNTWHIIHSGLDHVELNPIKLMSSSVILLNIFRISSGVSLITIFVWVRHFYIVPYANTRHSVEFNFIGLFTPAPVFGLFPASLYLWRYVCHITPPFSGSNLDMCLWCSLFTRSLLHLKQNTYFL
jgi:hypothetical protein